MSTHWFYQKKTSFDELEYNLKHTGQNRIECQKRKPKKFCEKERCVSHPNFEKEIKWKSINSIALKYQDLIVWPLSSPVVLLELILWVSNSINDQWPVHFSTLLQLKNLVFNFYIILNCFSSIKENKSFGQKSSCFGCCKVTEDFP